MARPKKEAPNRSDGRYEVKITIGHDMNGGPIRKSFYSDISKDDAKRQAEAYRINSKASEMAGIGIIDKNITFGEWAIIWLEKYKRGSVRENTYMESYQRPVQLQLIPYFGNAYMRNIRPTDIKGFFNIVQGKYSESHLKKLKLCLNAIFEAAIDNDMCIKNPVRNIKFSSQYESSERNIFSEDQYNIALEFCDEHKYGIYTRILLELGLRPCELCGLRFSDIDVQKSTIHIQRDVVKGKGGVHVDDAKTKESNRILPVSSALLTRMSNLPQFGTDEYILQSGRGNIMDSARYTHLRHDVFFEALLKKYPHMPHLTPHELRHTCGTIMYRKTHDIYAVSKYLGHSNINITAKLYVHSDAESLRSGLNIV